MGLKYRMSRKDWEIINTALAYYEAEVEGNDDARYTEQEVAATRLKVHERRTEETK